MKKTTNKVVLIGAGAVGTSFLYSAMNQGIAQEFGIIDINKEGAIGNELDLEDSFSTIDPSINNVKAGGYELVSDADVLVITAGRPQKPGETRIDMVKDNAIIMKNIALEVVKNGFKGVTIIASNPVDIMTSVYQEVTGYEATKVISSGTSLDTARLLIELSKRLNIEPKSIQAYVLGEHGDSSVSTFAHAKIGGVDAQSFFEAAGIDEAKQAEIHEVVWKKAYEIINRKRATFYGIGASLANITRAILNDQNTIIAVGAKLTGQYGLEGIYFGTPCVINSKGIAKILEYPVSDNEKKALDDSSMAIKAAVKTALEAIN